MSTDSDLKKGVRQVISNKNTVMVRNKEIFTSHH